MSKGTTITLKRFCHDGDVERSDFCYSFNLYAESMNPQNESLLNRAKKIMGELSAVCDEEEIRESEMSNSKCVNCHLNNIDFLLETDLWYEGDTTISFSFSLISNQKIEVNSQLDKKLDLFVEQLKNLPHAPASIERDYGTAPDDSEGHIPDFPERKNVGTYLLVHYVLGNESHTIEDRDWQDHNAWPDEKVAYDPDPLELKTTILSAVNFAAVVLEEIEKSKLV